MRNKPIQHSIHTELDWVATIVESGTIEHSVTAMIYDIHTASPDPVHASVNIKLAEGHTYRDFATKVDDQELEAGTGFNGRDYALPLALVKEKAKGKNSATLTISFKEIGASRKLLGAHLYELSHIPTFFRSSTILVITAAVPATRKGRLLWAILSKLLRQQAPQLLPVGWESDTTEELGMLRRSLGVGFPKTSVVYALPTISWPDAIASLLIFMLGAAVGAGLAMLFQLWFLKP